MKSKNSPCAGNVLFLILIAVILFAALFYALGSSMRSNPENAGSETALIASSEITQYASALENALTYLSVSKQCSVGEISFERSPFDGSDTDYVNAYSPPNFSCHVFHGEGGRISAQPAPQNANDGREWAYIEARVLKIGVDQTACGSECNEILAILGGVTRATCEKLNERIIGLTDIPVQSHSADYEQRKYVGLFDTGLHIDGGAEGHRSMCIQDKNGTYYFYNVLMPR